ncbi:inner membrane symporter YicJ [Oxobacter pfennigii]|uniref:Inner membrane symporter YicJ n=1 Tax=Oxobacter pfennigii TaxID=36849 RepID=A0A0P8WBW8_9CLOT|nr:glycoside-pentoside-hexuronide (GPH):cation symporter [Oxobacter pfennigii]KPU45211.1 inner membrane symporter YicJ [Oxobacter pfennigii]
MHINTTVPESLKKDKFGMGIGGFGYNLAAAGIMTYLTLFYTDNMLISAASVSMILFVSRIIDACTDLLVGTLVDRTKTKWGKARPWLLWMAVPAALSLSATYFVPAFSDTGRVVYAFITYNLMAFFFQTAIALPLQSLVALITPDPKHRLHLSQLYGFFTTAGAVLVNFFATPIMQALGGGSRGYFLYFTITGIIGLFLILVCFKLTTERTESSEGPIQEKIPVSEGIKIVMRNRYWWNALGIYLMTSLVPACWAATAYYCIYWLNGGVDVGVLMSMLWGGITVGIILFAPVSQKLGKMPSAAIGLGMQALGSVLLWLAPTSIPMLWVSTAFRSLGVGGLSGNMNAMLAEVADYGEWKFGKRTEGLVYSGASFGGKVGSGIGGAVVAGLLAWGQYVPNAPTQAPLAMNAIKIAFVGAPFIGSSLIIIMLLFFNVEKKMPQIRKDLEERKAKAQAQTL